MSAGQERTTRNEVEGIVPASFRGSRATEGPKARRFRLRKNAYKAALFAHILASVGWFGVATFVAVCGLAASLSPDSASSGAFYRSIELAPSASIPFGLAAVGSGAVLGVGTSYGLTRHWWVLVKIMIAVGVIATDGLVVGQAARDAVLTGVAPTALYGATVAHVVVLAVATGLAVFKPRGRTPWAGPLPSVALTAGPEPSGR
jgi:hypothetical protein